MLKQPNSKKETEGPPRGEGVIKFEANSEEKGRALVKAYVLGKPSVSKMLLDYINTYPKREEWRKDLRHLTREQVAQKMYAEMETKTRKSNERD